MPRPVTWDWAKPRLMPLIAGPRNDMPGEGLVRTSAEVGCTIRLSPATLDQLLDGALSPTWAYTTGKLKVEGSLGVAMKLAARLED